MRLKNLFNKNYFIQNVLKSKAVIVLVLGLIPILNALVVMTLVNENSGNVVLEFGEISIINIIGMYVLPVVVSMCLFGYLFKRKSVDFINSMPLSRKQIFITNTIGGILLIVAMMVINALILFVQSLIFSNLVLPFNMIVDWFLLFTIAYIFVFVVSNLAATLAGNNVTMIVLTLLIIFFVPFMHSYISGFDGTLSEEVIYTQSADCVECAEVYTTGSPNVLREIEKENTYTLPYNILTSLFTGDGTIYNTTSIIKMVILTIAYIVLGIVLFEKRKMEVNEISFKKASSHFLVKSLTLIPIFLLVLIVINDGISFALSLFILVLVITYVIIYDLMTIRSIKNFKLGFVYFVLTAAITTGLYYGVDAYYNNAKEFTKEDIGKIDQVAVYVRGVDYARYDNEKSYGVYLKDKDIIQIVKENITNPVKYDEFTSDIAIKLKLNKKEYETNIYLPNEDYERLVRLVINNKEYIKEFKNIDYLAVNAISVDNINIIGKNKDEFLKILKESIESIDLDRYMEVQTVEYIRLRMYTNHKNISYEFPVTITRELYNKYCEIVNRDFLEKTEGKYDLDIYNMEIISPYGSFVEDDHYYYGYKENTLYSLVSYLLELDNVNVDSSKTMVKITGNADTDYRDERFSVVLNYEGKLKEILKESFVRGGAYD